MMSLDEEILSTVHAMFGPSVRIVDCEKTSSLQKEETLMINGVPIKLDGMEGDDATAIKNALLDGQMPSVDLLNQLLYQAELLRQPIQLETSLSVKSSIVTMEEVCVSKHGNILDERTCETKEDFIYQSNQQEILQPVLERGLKDVPLKMVDNSHTFTRKEVTEKQNTRASPQKSATFTCIPSSISRDASKKSHKVLNSDVSIDSSECCDTDSTVSDWSANPFSRYVARTNSAISTSSALTATSQAMHSASTNFFACNGNRSNVSCDSGHDGVYHSVSQSTAITPWNKNGATITGNSFSSCYDVASSSEELEIAQNKCENLNNRASSSKAQKILGKKDQQQYRKPQTSISLPFQSYIDDNCVLRYSNGKLICGPLDCLITHLVPTHDYAPESDFVFTFLLCSRLFVKPNELIVRLHQIWAQQREFTLRTSKAKIAVKLIKLLKQWIETFPYDFHDDNVMHEVRILCKSCMDIDATLSNDISAIVQRSVETLSELNKYEEMLQSYSKPILRRSSDELDKCSITDLDTASKYNLMRSESQPITKQLKKTGNCFANSVTKVQALSVMCICAKHTKLSHQLTAIELDYLSHIGAEELLYAFTPEFQCYMVSESITNQQQKNTSTKNVEQTKEVPSGNARNLEAYVQWFNRLSYLTATEIVKCYKKKHRVQMIEYWIETARECFNTGNFNSLMAILAGLNLNAVTRLKKTWSRVQSAKFSILEHQMDPSLNFSSYRSTMKAAVWRSEGATDARQRVVIPFFTLFLKDLCILNESSASRLSNDHINFEKFSYISKQADDFNKWKQTNCPYEKAANIVMFLQSSEVLNEKSLLLASFACEAPDNGEEKERYKLLRSASN